jgi:hypothetical protein
MQSLLRGDRQRELRLRRRWSGQSFRRRKLLLDYPHHNPSRSVLQLKLTANAMYIRQRGPERGLVAHSGRLYRFSDLFGFFLAL